MKYIFILCLLLVACSSIPTLEQAEQANYNMHRLMKDSATKADNWDSVKIYYRIQVNYLIHQATINGK